MNATRIIICSLALCLVIAIVHVARYSSTDAAELTALGGACGFLLGILTCMEFGWCSR